MLNLHLRRTQFIGLTGQAGTVGLEGGRRKEEGFAEFASPQNTAYRTDRTGRHSQVFAVRPKAALQSWIRAHARSGQKTYSVSKHSMNLLHTPL